MALIRWEPFRELDSLQREMNHLFDALSPNLNEGAMTTGPSFTPAAELHETPDSIELRVEVPGMEPKEIDVQVSAEAVSVRGERKSETKTTEKGMTRSEFRYGSFQRIIPLPTKVQNDQVQAEYANGVLRLSLPKAEAEKNKVVRINLNAKAQQGNEVVSQSQGNGQAASQPHTEAQSV